MLSLISFLWMQPNAKASLQSGFNMVRKIKYDFLPTPLDVSGSGFFLEKLWQNHSCNYNFYKWEIFLQFMFHKDSLQRKGSVHILLNRKFAPSSNFASKNDKNKVCYIKNYFSNFFIYPLLFRRYQDL